MKSELKWIAAALVLAGVLNTAAAPANAQLFQWPWQKHEEAPVEAAPDPQAPPPPVEDVRRAELPAPWNPFRCRGRVREACVPRRRPAPARRSISTIAPKGPQGRPGATALASAGIPQNHASSGAPYVAATVSQAPVLGSATSPARTEEAPSVAGLSVPRHGPPRYRLRLARCRFLFRAWPACSPRRSRPQGLRLPLIRSHRTILE